MVAKKKSGEGVLHGRPWDVLAHGESAREGSASSAVDAVVDVDHTVRRSRRLGRVVPAAGVRRAPAERVRLDPACRPHPALRRVVHPAAWVSAALL